jgi:hypothetical protein
MTLARALVIGIAIGLMLSLGLAVLVIGLVP